jgi:hypothetical protein
MIEAEYTLTFADYKAAHRLYLRRHPWSMFSYVFQCWMIPILVLASAAIAVWARVHGDANATRLSWGTIEGPLIFAMALPAFRWWTLWSGYNNIFPRGTGKIARLTLTQEQVISAIPDRNEGRFYWKTIERYAEDKNGMILFVSKKRYLIVPHRALNEAQWTEMRALVAAKVGQL